MVIGQFLNVIARNSNAEQLVLCALVFPMQQLTSLLLTSDLVRKLAIQGCQATEAPGLWEDEFLKALRSGNKVLDTLGMSDSDVAHLAPIAEQLGHHLTLRNLVFGGTAIADQRTSPSIATSNFVGSILENGTSSTLKISIVCCSFAFERENFIPIARAAIDGKLWHQSI